jgi:hypothetical protein
MERRKHYRKKNEERLIYSNLQSYFSLIDAFITNHNSSPSIKETIRYSNDLIFNKWKEK